MKVSSTSFENLEKSTHECQFFILLAFLWSVSVNYLPRHFSVVFSRWNVMARARCFFVGGVGNDAKLPFRLFSVIVGNVHVPDWLVPLFNLENRPASVKTRKKRQMTGSYV